MKYDGLNFSMLNYKYKEQLNHKHVILAIVVIIIVVISIFLLISGIKKGKESDDKKLAEQPSTEENITQIDNEPKVYPLPVYSDDSKAQVSSIYKSETKMVFLTFDDGPSQTVTPVILDILKENDIKATFFVLGNRVELYPEILKREYEEGHFIANHGYSHKYDKIYAVTNNVLDEYVQTEECIRNALGKPEYSSHLFRFPGGSVGGKYKNVKKQAMQLLTDNQIAYVDWNCLTKDAEGNFDKDQLYDNMVQTAKNKNSIVVLMHDAGNKKSTAEALQNVINYFKDNGYEFMNFYDIMK